MVTPYTACLLGSVPGQPPTPKAAFTHEAHKAASCWDPERSVVGEIPGVGQGLPHPRSGPSTAPGPPLLQGEV